MLRLWRDLYRITLHPDQVALVRVQRAKFSRAKELSRQVTVAANTSRSWQAAIEQLGELIADIKSAKADVELVLSNHFVRYAVVPWSHESMDSLEEEAMTRICFEQTYGSLAMDWDLRLSESGYGESRLASAVDRELMLALSNLMAKTSLRLISIQPYLMKMFNQFRQHIANEDCLFMLGEPGKLCLAQIRNKQWRQIRLVSVGELADEVNSLINREVLLSGFDPDIKKYFFAPGLTENEFSQPGIHLLAAPEDSSGLQFGLTLRSA